MGAGHALPDGRATANDEIFRDMINSRRFHLKIMKTKARTLVFFLTLLAVFAPAACRRSNTLQPANAGSASTSEQPAGGAAQTGDKFYFRGTISGNLSIEMTLVRDGERISGSYFYPKVGKNIDLKGSVDKSGNVELRESDESGKDTGIFKGLWKLSSYEPGLDLNDIEGKWSRPDGSKVTDFLVFQQPIEFTGAARVIPKVIKEVNKQKYYTIDAQYPQIEADARFAKFNQEARGLITKDVAAFKTAETAQENDLGTELPAEAQDSTLSNGYDFRLATDDLISVAFAESTYSRGAAHPNSLTTVLNYDVKNGKRLMLADLFKPKANYLNVIASYCMKQLTERAKNDDDMLSHDSIETGASARAENYNAWAITKKGLWITFDPYQVAAYAAGPQHVLVPYSAMKDIIKPDGPIAVLAK